VDVGQCGSAEGAGSDWATEVEVCCGEGRDWTDGSDVKLFTVSEISQSAVL
jgi:hypothetical protein